MKLSVLALDYDGTIAQRDVLEPSIRDAMAAARAAGIVVLLVTGRMISLSCAALSVTCTSSMASSRKTER